jgi:hypothetical protein
MTRERPCNADHSIGHLLAWHALPPSGKFQRVAIGMDSRFAAQAQMTFTHTLAAGQFGMGISP